jgi:hypothetical protein
MASSYRIAFVLPWFGDWPNWMPLYWESCRWNPDIHWLIFTDQLAPAEAPENVAFERLSLPDLYGRIGHNLSLNLRPPFRSHKLCDFKITMGSSFRDVLQGYDFWGMCDLDMAWGQIRDFYPDELLAQYDILTSSRRAINGQCTLFRNVPQVNELFWEELGALEILMDPASRNFSELGIDRTARAEERAGHLRTLRRRLHVSETWNDWEETAERLELEEKGSLADLPRLIGTCRWEEGRVFHNASGAEMVFCHWLFAKDLYAERARAYLFWPDSMLGWEMNERDIVMRFKRGHLLARLRYFLTLRLGWVTRYHLLRFERRLRRFVKNRFPWLLSILPKSAETNAAP